MRVAALQQNIAWEDPAENHRRARALLERAAAGGAGLAALPEMFSTGFSMEAGRLAEPPGGPSETFLKEEARRLSLSILASIPEAGSPKARNMALLVSPSGSVRRYAKIHPFSFAGEDQHYAPGERVITEDVEDVHVTPLICYDLRFPEPFRLAAAETDLFVVIANWPNTRREHWRTLLRARAIENLCFVAGVNRSGEGNGLSYAGGSMILSPWGETIAEAGAGEEIIFADIDPSAVQKARSTFPALSDRRPQAYRR